MKVKRSSSISKKPLSVTEATKKIEHYCAYQERNASQVKRKLKTYLLSEAEIGKIIEGLVESGYLNEERFAKVFTGGKFRMKRWGRIKIEHRLRSEGLDPTAVAKASKEINQQEYEATLEELIRKKINTLKGKEKTEVKQKTIRFALSKGYESELVWKTLEKVLRSGK
ncbi:MAG: RecX family transcriptional regulator [Bacteroidetes bacterium]|nr:RecX family transcriptional regulator [Bacteroidota bacterium]